MVEFAIVVPMLLVLLTGIIQFGLLFNNYITLTDAVRSGARTLALGRGVGVGDPCDPAVTQTIGSATGLTASQLTVTVTVSGTGGSTCGRASPPYGDTGQLYQGDEGEVTATYPYSFKVFGVSLFQGQLSASASDEIE